MNQLTIANIIDENSYISFEAALQHYGLFDQYLRTITSISENKTYDTKFSDWKFRYIKTKEGLFKDYNKYNQDGRLVKIATKEKIILDFLTYMRTISKVDLIIEIIKNYRDEFDIQRLIEMSKDYSITVKRSLGILLDIIGADSKILYSLVKGNRNHSFMTKDSMVFNAKWRIYIDNHLQSILNNNLYGKGK